MKEGGIKNNNYNKQDKIIIYEKINSQIFIQKCILIIPILKLKMLKTTLKIKY